MGPRRKEALGKFLINFVLLYLGAGIVSKMFSSDPLPVGKTVFTLLSAAVLLIIGVYLHPKE